MKKPKVSVVSIALKEEELDKLREMLSEQTFDDFEFIPITGKISIPEAWNKGIEKAKGKYVLFTESDVEIPENWIEKIYKYLEKGKDFAMGYQVILPQKTHCMSNVGLNTEWAKETKFNENLDISEDTEWFTRLQNKYNFTIKKDKKLPIVFHNKSPAKFGWAFKHGIHRSEIWLKHGYKGKSPGGVTSRRFNLIISQSLTLLGQFFGIIKHPILALKKLIIG